VIDCPEAPGRWPGLLAEWYEARAAVGADGSPRLARKARRSWCSGWPPTTLSPRSI